MLLLASAAALNILSIKSVFAQSWGGAFELPVAAGVVVVVVVLFVLFGAVLLLAGDVTEDEIVGGEDVGAIACGIGASGDRISVGGPINMEIIWLFWSFL